MFWGISLFCFGLQSILTNAWSISRSLKVLLPRRNKVVHLPLPNSRPIIGLDENALFVDSYFMKLALAEAKKADLRGEVPIGALVVREISTNNLDKQGINNSCHLSYEILSSDSNRVEAQRDASAHAELLAMRRAAHKNDAASWRLLNATLYTTVEPCAMCLAAAQSFRVRRIVYGAPDMRLGAISTYLHLLDKPHPFHNIHEVIRGVHEEESATLLRDFFRRQRRKRKAREYRPTHRWLRSIVSTFKF